jgi:SAM-dependent methyltransferase
MPMLEVEQVACGGCGADRPARLFSETYRLLQQSVLLGINRCGDCGLVYVSPRLTPTATQLVYEHDAEHTISHNYCWSGSASEQRFRPLLARLAKLGKPGRLLDVGCGGGHFLRAAAAAGRWQVAGIEPVSDAARQAAHYAKCDVHCTTLDRVNLAPESQQVVTLLGVLEHVHEPRQTLIEAHQLLASDGLLGIYVPNFDYLRLKDAGPLARLRFGQSSHLHPQEHLFGYQAKTMVRLLEATGYHIERIDVGPPFAHGWLAKRLAKQLAFAGVRLLYRTTGIHLGGLEIIARKRPAEPAVDKVAA